MTRGEKPVLSLLFTLLIVVLLVFSGPATAVQVALSQDKSSLVQNEVITFTATVDLSAADENVPISLAHLQLSGPTSKTILFDPFTGDVLSGNTTPNEIVVTVSGSYGPSTYGYGYGEKYDYGYGYGFMGFGYGYGFTGPRTVQYTIKLNTSNLLNGTYQANVAVNVGGTIMHSPLTTFTVLPGSLSTTVTIPPLTNGSVNSSVLNTSLGAVYYSVAANGTTPAVDLNITVTVSNPTGVTPPTGSLSRYVNISVNDTSWATNISMVQVRIYYDPSEIPSGVSEGSLRPLRFTSGSWVRLTGPATLADGTIVYAAGVDTTNHYVWANLSHFSLYGVGGTVAAPPAPSRGGGGVITRLSGEKVLLVANSIDSALATDFLAYLDSNNIEATIVNASGFTEAARVENRIIIILGGPDAYEGVGEITSEVLTDAEEAVVRTAGAQAIFVKYNVWTDRYTYKQMVIVIAGSDRTNTQAAETKHSETVKERVLG